MTLLEWALSTTTTTFLITVLGWLCRNLILTRLKETVAHEFNTKLENLRSDLRKSEDSLNAELRSREREIEALRSGALAAMVSRQSVLDKRRLEAADELWGSIQALAPFKFICEMMKTIDFQKALQETSKNQKAREFFGGFHKNLDLSKMPNVHKSRPFVSEYAWALFSAYQAIVGHATAQLLMLSAGLNSPELLNSEHVVNVAKAALPYYSDYIDKHGSQGCGYLLEPLETELLKELQRTMRGEESDKANVQQAATIMKEVAIVNTEITNLHKSQVSTR